jgi:hypothetical protein
MNDVVMAVAAASLPPEVHFESSLLFATKVMFFCAARCGVQVATNSGKTLEGENAWRCSFRKKTI